MKKLLALLLVMMLVVPFSALAADTYEIALVTDQGNIDDQSFNQSAWEGVVEYATANNVSYQYYRPSEDSTDARLESIKAAVDKGAKVVVCPGYLFEDTVDIAQNEYPDVMFLLLDGEPHPTGDYVNYFTAENTHNILYQEEQAGYFAGYAAVKDGYTKLGFLGGVDVPAVVRYGFGFVLGADAAAVEMGLTDVEVKYWYAGGFGPTDEIRTKMAGWYTEGTEVVFACGGGIYLSALAAATEANGKIIGVDTDQGHLDEAIITSAMKDLKNSVVIALTDMFSNGGKWSADYAGKTVTLGVNDDCVGLPTEDASWRLSTFTVADYEALYAKVKSGEIVVSDNIDDNPATTIVKADYQN